MKTIKEVYETINASEELKTKFGTLKKLDDLKAFLSENGYDGDPKDFIQYLTEQEKQMRDLSMDQLEQVSGGFNFGTLIGSVIIWWGCAGASICIEAFTEDDCIDSLT